MITGEPNESDVLEPVSKTAVLSLHDRIIGDIERNILSGKWPPGTRIPSEHDLCGDYDCSRMTVNKALSELARSGLIERRRKAGSFVMRAPSRTAALEISDVRAEVEELGAAYRFEILTRRRRRAGRMDAGRLEGIGDGPLLDLTCRHWAGDRPFCIEERLINLTATPEAVDEPFADTPPGSWLLARAPWTSAEHRIAARPAGVRPAALLDIALGACCLTIQRRTWSGEAPITYVQLTYPGELHELVARFSPSHR
ncbi:histidine utilization repressor [Methyloraptor flagellatus]|jgi:GntR family histidine utilization transcriptional repressor|uniref:Histidine utilization repressor n=1 Tax=Methyloraptor flagellatus TaxID=3162530 RepID=A0AAU7X4A9_9HYPH